MKDPGVHTDWDFILWGIEAVVSGGSENRTIEAVFRLVDECRE